MDAKITGLSQNEIKKILIINLGGIGDILLSTPALKALRKSYPESRIYLLVSARVLEFTKELAYIDDVFIFDLGAGLINLLHNLKTLLNLRKAEIDLAINMRTLVSKKSAFKMHFLLSVINPRLKAGRDTEGRGYFFDFKMAEADYSAIHEIDCNIETVQSLGINVEDSNLDFKIDDDAFKRVSEILEKEGITKKDILVCIHSGGKPSHRWPLENFLEALKEVNKKMNCKFVVTGGKEASVADDLAGKNDIKIINLAGKLNIKELGALISRSNLFIGNDTGPMHIAAALKTPVIAIFGPGYVDQFDPRKISDKAVIMYKKADCAPCNKVVCKSMKCLKGISPADVTKAALDLLR